MTTDPMNDHAYDWSDAEDVLAIEMIRRHHPNTKPGGPRWFQLLAHYSEVLDWAFWAGHVTNGQATPSRGWYRADDIDALALLIRAGVVKPDVDRPLSIAQSRRLKAILASERIR